MTEHDDSTEESRPKDEPADKHVARRGPISKPEPRDDSPEQASEDPDRYDAG